jgi:hypothetical protein
MTAPKLTVSQLTPLLDRLVRAAEERGEPAPLLLVRGRLDAEAGDSLAVRAETVDLLSSDSPLEIRAAAVGERARPLAVVTPCEQSDLGLDLIARAFRRKVYPVDRWASVAQLFDAERPSKQLARHAELADVLIDEASTGQRFDPVTSTILDLDTALAALSRSVVGRELESLVELLVWAETPEAAAAIRRLDGKGRVLELLRQHHVNELGPGAAVVHTALSHCLGETLTGAALAAQALFATADPHPSAYSAVERTLGNPHLPVDAYRDLGDAAVRRVWSDNSGRQVHRWIDTADGLLREWGWDGEAWRSPILRTGFAQRLQRAAEALTAWRGRADDRDLARAAEQCIEEVAAHREAVVSFDPRRLERLRMAARVIRRGGFDLPEVGTLAEALVAYRRDGAWLDRARGLLAHGDDPDELHELYRSMTDEADTARDRQSVTIGHVLAQAANPPVDGVIGVEHLLDRIVAPLAERVPVLVVVLDGMGWPSFLDVDHHLARHGWAPLRDDAGWVDQSMIAALPTVTEYSRTSLLSGELTDGDARTEKRRFRDHPALVRASRTEYPPELFHKAELKIDGGIDARARTVEAAIEDTRRQIVGVVINNIDERLKEVANPPEGWNLAALTPLGDLLEKARQVGRAVVVTADHGHVLERETARREGPGGERWRDRSKGPAADGELEVSGPRVLTDDHTAIMPVLEQVRYSTARRHGYHGGLTLRELAIPLAVYSADVGGIEGWRPTTFAPPSWWHPAPDLPPADRPATGSAAPVRSEPKPPKRGRPSVPDQPQLFEPPAPEPVVDDEPADAASPMVTDTDGTDPVGPSIERILDHPQVANQLVPLRLDDKPVGRALAMLDRYGTSAVSLDRLADQIGYPQRSMARLVNQIQRLVNIDGASVLVVSSGDVRFDRPLLELQLGLA